MIENLLTQTNTARSSAFRRHTVPHSGIGGIDGSTFILYELSPDSKGADVSCFYLPAHPLVFGRLAILVALQQVVRTLHLPAQLASAYPLVRLLAVGKPL